jgi:CheY-like chemotaxis protein
MTLERDRNPRPVLLVEDNETDVMLFTRGLAKIHSPLPLQVIEDGQAAWDYLSGSGSTSRPTRPSLIILDLKLPKKSGLEILGALKRDPALARIPVLVLTSSNQRAEIDAVYSLGADVYLVKPTDPVRTLEMIQGIHAYWLALHQDPDHLGADPSLSQLRRLAEAPSSLTC